MSFYNSVELHLGTVILQVIVIEWFVRLHEDRSYIISRAGMIFCSTFIGVDRNYYEIFEFSGKFQKNSSS